MERINIGLCEGRHNIPHVTDYIFPSVVNPTDIVGLKETIEKKFETMKYANVNLYVTGLTVALVEVIKYCLKNDIKLTLYHYNKEDNNYYPQTVND